MPMKSKYFECTNCTHPFHSISISQYSTLTTFVSPVHSPRHRSCIHYCHCCYYCHCYHDHCTATIIVNTVIATTIIVTAAVAIKFAIYTVYIFICFRAFTYLFMYAYVALVIIIAIAISITVLYYHCCIHSFLPYSCCSCTRFHSCIHLHARIYLHFAIIFITTIMYTIITIAVCLIIVYLVPIQFVLHVLSFICIICL